MLLNKKFILNWGIPVLIALVVFAVVRPAMAQIMATDELSRYVLDNDVIVGEETVNGARQVYYMLNEEKIFVTGGRDNSHDPRVNKEYMTWVTDINGAGGQIFLYHIPTSITTTITGSSTNLNPRVSAEGEVVWERWLDERWQIFMYDGVRVKQLTDGDVSFNADVSGSQVVFVRQDDEKNMRTVLLDLSSRRAEVIAEGVEHRTPSFFEGNVVYDFGAGVRGDREAQKLREQRILDQQIQLEEISKQKEEIQRRAEEQKLLDEEIARQKEEYALFEEALLQDSLLDSAIQIISNVIEDISNIFVEENPVSVDNATVSSTELITETPSSTEDVVENIPPAEEIPVLVETSSSTEEIPIPVETAPIEPAPFEPVVEAEVLPSTSENNEQIPADVTLAEPTPSEPVIIEEPAEEIFTEPETIVTDNTEYFAETGAPETVTETDIINELSETPIIIEETLAQEIQNL